MKKLLGTLFAATLVLSACSQDDTKEEENKKSESTTEKKTDDKKDKKTKEDNKSKEEKKSQENEDNKSTQEDNSTEKQNTQETATNEQVQSQQPTTTQGQEQQTQQPATQEQQTQQANNNQKNEQRYDYDHNGVYRTPAEQRAHEQWINDQIEWNDKQQQASQNNHVDLNSLPPTDFDPTWMSESGQKQVNDLAEQKDSGQISQYEFNDRVSDVMNNELDNQQQ
ncbi:hypothetical protein ACKI6Z_00420 [Staphylococcus epidermidis]|uniref:hypothetical protein n=1 Tax=Staphylococcus epidermidis TaxID=1282 RepID=UPI00138DF84B|nr:hypothetical protein [Staphylococcus epidermidis]MDS3950485.1 hypothetical protein [Staphylococcus epidermidis]